MSLSGETGVELQVAGIGDAPQLTNKLKTEKQAPESTAKAAHSTHLRVPVPVQPATSAAYEAQFLLTDQREVWPVEAFFGFLRIDSSRSSIGTFSIRGFERIIVKKVPKLSAPANRNRPQHRSYRTRFARPFYANTNAQ